MLTEQLKKMSVEHGDLKKKLKIIPDSRIRTNPEFVRRPCGIPGIIIRKFGIRTVFLKMVDRKLKKIK